VKPEEKRPGKEHFACPQGRGGVKRPRPGREIASEKKSRRLLRIERRKNKQRLSRKRRGGQKSQDLMSGKDVHGVVDHGGGGGGGGGGVGGGGGGGFVGGVWGAVLFQLFLFIRGAGGVLPPNSL